MKIGIPKEIHSGERRVAATPDSVVKLQKLGFEVVIESGAGREASFDDDDYRRVGASVMPDSASVWSTADIVIKVQPPELGSSGSGQEAARLREGSCLISFVWPAKNRSLIEALAAQKVTLIAMDQIPRITRAQKYDALSSMANIAGYRAVVEAASHFGSFFAGQMTAAGKVPPAKVLVIGAGVAGLAAIGAARGLGAIVRAFDTRPAVREQVQSMGAEFLEVSLNEDGSGAGGYAKEMSKEFIDAEMELFLKQSKEVDIIVTTALIPGKPAPKLITEAMVKAMRPGSVIVDLAAEAGGNCELTHPGEVNLQHGVTIIGYVDMPSRLARTSSQLYASNLAHLLSDMGGAEHWRIDLEDQVVRGAIVLREGDLLWPPPRVEEPSPPVPKAPAVAPPSKVEPSEREKAAAARRRTFISALVALLGIFLLAALGTVAPPAFLSHLTVFVLACFVGWQVVWNVTPALHTPLMSVTNAISGIIILGGMLQLTEGASPAIVAVSTSAVLLATINVVGGFMVTQRMLRMFRR